MPWLDEVRAQRQAWEARRNSARQSYEAWRRLNNPRGAAHREAWEAEVRWRRAARLDRMEQDRELFRRLGPNQLPPPWPTKGPAATDESNKAGLPPPETPIFAPPGWNNHWYFRGF